MIELKDITVSFASVGQARPFVALDRLNLTIDDGEYVTLVGTNGAGKSTMLNVLAGTVPLAEGRILVDGRDVTDTTDFRRAEWLARVFPDPRVGTCDQLTVEENMAVAVGKLGRRGLQPANNAAQRKLFAERLAELNLGLESRLQTPVHLLSSGQRQSITVVMASLTQTRLLLLDEHVANLDPRTQKTVMDLSDRMIRSMGLAAVMVTHDVRHALEYGDRLIALKDGRVILDVSGAEKQRLTPADVDAVYEDLKIPA